MREYVIDSAVVADCVTAAAVALFLCCDVIGPCADVIGTGGDVITDCVCTTADVCCRAASDKTRGTVKPHRLIIIYNANDEDCNLILIKIYNLHSSVSQCCCQK